MDTKIGPVRQVRVTRCLDQYGIEMQVPSMSKNGSYSWKVISRGPNRYVDESWQVQEDPLHDVGMMSSTSVVEQSHSMTLHASKQQEQSNPMNYRSEEFIQINRRKWNDILACDNVERCSLAWKISKRLTAFVRHRELDHREVDGAVHWNRCFRSCDVLKKKWDDNKAWSSQEWKADTSMCDGTGQPVVNPQRGARPQQFVSGNDETQSELSVECRSFFNRVKDQVRKRKNDLR